MRKQKQIQSSNTYRVSEFFGMNTETKDIKAIVKGFTPDSLNWLTSTGKDAIILRRGSKLLGSTRNTGSGKITGLSVGEITNGSQVPFFTYGRKAKYYDSATDDTVEIGSSILPAATDGNDYWIFNYQNLAGSMMYMGSANGTAFKIPVANPGSSKDQALSLYFGFMRPAQGRVTAANAYDSSTKAKDLTTLYMSYIDRATAADYPSQTTGEAVGSSGSTNYTHTCSNIAAKRTVFAVSVSATVAAGTELFVDDACGNLTSNFGGTGTINYATGAIDVTFSSVTTGAVTCSYYYEDATSHGILDFSYSGTRVAGEGRRFAQFDGSGSLKAIFPLATTFYSFHTLKTWQTVTPVDDGNSGATNLSFRDSMGVSYPYSVYGGADGIYFVNTAYPGKPEIYVLRPYVGATQANIAIPKLMSQLLDLSSFSFDYAVIHEWQNYILVSCAQIRNGTADSFNSRTFLYNKKNGAWDLTDYAASRFATYNGTLLAGDSVTNNVFTLFSGFDDDDNLIPNYYTSHQTDFEMEGQKRFTKMNVDGLIVGSQSIKVSVSFDGSDFIDVFTIDGNGSYVDTGKSIAVGATTIGSKVAGGGNTVFANPFNVEFTVQSPLFQFVQFRFEALSGGYAQINYYEAKDIRRKSYKVPPVRISN